MQLEGTFRYFMAFYYLYIMFRSKIVQFNCLQNYIIQWQCCIINLILICRIKEEPSEIHFPELDEIDEVNNPEHLLNLNGKNMYIRIEWCTCIQYCVVCYFLKAGFKISHIYLKRRYQLGLQIQSYKYFHAKVYIAAIYLMKDFLCVYTL